MRHLPLARGSERHAPALFHDYKTYFSRLKRCAKNVSTNASNIAAMTIGSQNSSPVRSFSTRPFNERFGVQGITSAIFFRMLTWAAESSSRLDSNDGGCAANLRDSGGSGVAAS